MKKKAICILNYGIDGGVGTLAIRIAEWCKENSIKVFICIVKNNNQHIYEQLADLNVVFSICDDKTYTKQFDRIKDNSYQYVLINYFTLTNYYGKLLQENNSNIIRNILYQIGPGGAIYENGSNNKLKKLFASFVNRLIYRNYLQQLISEKQFFVLDEQCQSITQNQLNLVISNDLILRLPYRITKYENLEESFIFPAQKSICTVARFSFPFKGYLVGLVDGFEKLIGMDNDINLVIVGSGEDREILIDKINSKSDDVRKRIVLLDSVPYNEAKEIISGALIYIGMGTTIFDAADKLTIAIPVAINTMKLEGDSIFSDNPFTFAHNPGVYSEKMILDTIYRCLCMNVNEYFGCVKKQYEELNKYYCTDIFMEKILEESNSSTLCNTIPVIFRCFQTIKGINKIKG